MRDQQRGMFESLIDYNINYIKLNDDCSDGLITTTKLHIMCVDYRLPEYLKDIIFHDITVFDAMLICMSEAEKIVTTNSYIAPKKGINNYCIQDARYIAIYCVKDDSDPCDTGSYGISVLMGNETPESFQEKVGLVYGYYDLRGTLKYDNEI